MICDPRIFYSIADLDKVLHSNKPKAISAKYSFVIMQYRDVLKDSRLCRSDSQMVSFVSIRSILVKAP